MRTLPLPVLSVEPWAISTDAARRSSVAVPVLRRSASAARTSAPLDTKLAWPLPASTSAFRRSAPPPASSSRWPLPVASTAASMLSVPVVPVPLRTDNAPLLPAVRPARAALSATAEVVPALPTRLTVTAATLPTMRPLCSDRNRPPAVLLAATVPTLNSTALVDVPTPVAASNRTRAPLRLVAALALSASASVIAPPDSTLMARLSVAPAVPVTSWPSTTLPAACTRCAPLFVTRPPVAPMVTVPAAASTSTVAPSAAVDTCTPPTPVPMATLPLASTEMLPAAEFTSAWMAMSPPRVCSRMWPLPVPVADELMPPITLRLPLVSTRATRPEASTMPPRFMPSGASTGGRVSSTVRPVASVTNTPPAVVLVATRVPSAVRSAALPEPMPLAAYSTASAASPTRLLPLPVRLSMMAPLVVRRPTLLVTVIWLTRMSPPATRLARPLVPTDVMLVPSVMVMPVPAVSDTRPPEVPLPPETRLPPSVMLPAVAVRLMSAPVPVASRSTPLAVVKLPAVAKVIAPRLVTLWLISRVSPLPCASRAVLPVPRFARPVLVVPFRVMALAWLTVPLSMLMLPLRVVSAMSPVPVVRVWVSLATDTSPVIWLLVKRPMGPVVRTPLTPSVMSPSPVLVIDSSGVSIAPRLMPVLAVATSSRLRRASALVPSVVASAWPMLPRAEYSVIESASISLRISMLLTASSVRVSPAPTRTSQLLNSLSATVIEPP